MTDDTPDPAQEAADALRAAGIAVEPVGEELERWRVGDLIVDDATLVRIAVSRGLVSE